MKILLDTHTLIWALEDNANLSREVREMLISENNDIYVSVASLWEIAIKNAKKPKLMPYTSKEISNYCQMAGYIFLSLGVDSVNTLNDIKIKPNNYISNYDPFDRILLSQAKTNNMKFITHDKNFSNYDEDCIILF